MLGKRCFRFLLRILFRVRIVGASRWRLAPHALVVANHVSFLDGVLIAAFSPAPLLFAVTAEYARHPVYSNLLGVLAKAGLGAFVPLDPANPFALRAIRRRLASGGGAAVFPEGAISASGALGPLHQGAANAAVSSRSDVLPITIRGPEHSIFGRQPSRQRTWLPQVTLAVGHPIACDGHDAHSLTQAIRVALSNPAAQLT